MEGTPLLTELNQFDQTLSPTDILDTTSVDRLRALLNHSDRHVQQLASKILLEHNHDVALQTQDHKIVPLSFAVLSKFSEIFPEDSDFLLSASEPIPIPVSSTSLNLVIQAWKGESLKQLIGGDDKAADIISLLEGAFYLAAEDSLSKGYLINKMINALAPDLNLTFPEPRHVHIRMEPYRQCESHYEQLKQLLTLAKTIDYRATLVVAIFDPGKLWPLRWVFENDQAYPLQALQIAYEGPRCSAEASFFQFLKRNQSLESLDIRWTLQGTWYQKGLPKPLYPTEKPHERFLRVASPEDLSCADTLLEALKGNRSVKELVIQPNLTYQLNVNSLRNTLQMNTTLDALTLNGEGYDYRQEGRWLTALQHNRSLKKLTLHLEAGFYRHALKPLLSLIRENPRLESLCLYMGGTLHKNELTSLFQAVKENSAIKQFCHSTGLSYYGGTYLKAVGNLLDGNQTLRKLKFSTLGGQTFEPWIPFFQDLKKNETLEELTFYARIPDGEHWFRQLMAIIARHPKLTSLGLPSVLTPQQMLTICEFLRNNPKLEKLTLSGNPPLGESGRSSEVLKSLLAALENNTHLRSLDLQHCNLQYDEAMLLAKHLEHHHVLQELWLAHNKFPLEGIEALFKALKSNRSLESISLPWKNDYYRSRPTSTLLAALETNQTLRHLRLAGHPDREALNQLRKVIQRKEYFNLELY